MHFNKSHIIILLFLLLAFLATYFSFSKIPHSLVIHINNEWHLLLVGETNPAHLEYHGSEFTSTASNTANLWLNGRGILKWQSHEIDIMPTGIRINQQMISKSDEHSAAHLTLYPDGRISKGKLDLHN